MGKEEILAGLRNAIDRGQPLEKAIESFISAGYNPEEVKEASQEVNLSIIHHLEEPQIQKTNSNRTTQEIINPQPTLKPLNQNQITQLQRVGKTNPPIQEQMQPQADNNQLNEEPIKTKKKMPAILVILIVLLIILLLTTGIFVLFGKEILELLFPKV